MDKFFYLSIDITFHSLYENIEIPELNKLRKLSLKDISILIRFNLMNKGTNHTSNFTK